MENRYGIYYYCHSMPKKQKGANSTEKNEVTIDFGERKVNSQNFSKTVVLPKTALTGCGCNLDDDIKMNVKLVTNGKEKVIMLTPICDKSEKETSS